MKILSIETSCDETAVACIEVGDSPLSDTSLTVHMRENLVHSQIDVHREFGGVFPALAKREHQKNIVPLLLLLLKKLPSHNEVSHEIPDRLSLQESLATILSKEPLLYEHFCTYLLDEPVPDLDIICVTTGPGLEPALWVGINAAQALGALWGIPVIPINHMEGHIMSVLAPALESHTQSTGLSSQEIQVSNHQTFSLDKNPFTYPLIALLISGGHTEWVLSPTQSTYEILGKTRDDAVGEAFDKVARILGLPYPGGPEISRYAEQYRLKTISPHHDEEQYFPGIPGTFFPRPMMQSKDYDVSFSGLKTAVLYKVHELKKTFPETLPLAYIARIAYEFEEAVGETLAHKTHRMVREVMPQMVIVAGGVAANHRIREVLCEKLQPLLEHDKILFPSSGLTGDNALMIALAGYFKRETSRDLPLRAQGNMTLNTS